MAHSPARSHLASTALLLLGAALFAVLPAMALAQAPAAQQPAPAEAQPDPTTQPPQQRQQSGQAPVAAEPQAVGIAAVAGNGDKLPVTLEILQQRLVGKQFFLRGGWLGNSLSFTERGLPTNDPKPGSFTLSLIQITSVSWDARRVEIEGTRYAIHFLGNLPYESTANEVEHVNLYPKHGMRISIARAKIDKDAAKVAKVAAKGEKGAKPQQPAATMPSPETTDATPAAPTAAPQPAKTATAATAVEQAENPSADKAKSSASVKNLSQVAQILNDALERVFAPALDTTMRAQLPEFWQLYYESQRTGKRFDPRSGNVFHASAVDKQARILTSIAPASNEFAQSNNIVGIALYRVVIGADGALQQVAAERPIGFGLDENAVAAIRKATFQPALKAGQPVAELLDLSVSFRIYSDLERSSAITQIVQTADGTTTAAPAPAATVKAAMPGPFAVQQQQQQASQPPPPAAAEPQPEENAPIVVDPGPAPAAQPTDPQISTPPANPPATPPTQPTDPQIATPPATPPAQPPASNPHSAQ